MKKSKLGYYLLGYYDWLNKKLFKEKKYLQAFIISLTS